MKNPFGGVGETLTMDALDPNPHVTYLQTTGKHGPYGTASPRMFNSGTGDLPPFTASCVDPQVLYQVPWQLRHAPP